jgi:hypothetical protein
MTRHPIVSDVPVKSYLHHAFPLAVGLVNPNVRPWLLNHYINVSAFAVDAGPMGIDYNDPLTVYSEILTIVPMGLEFFQRDSNLLELLRQAIDADYRAVICIDEYHLPGTQSYHYGHFVHITLIRGYDDKSRAFSCFRLNARGAYQTMNLDYEQVQRGFLSALSMESAALSRHSLYHGYIVQFLSPKKNFVTPFPVSVSKLAGDICDYHNARDSPGDLHLRFGFSGTDRIPNPYGQGHLRLLGIGSNVHHGILAHLEGCRLRQWRFDFRLIHFLHEHKSGIGTRLRFLADAFPDRGWLSSVSDEWGRLVSRSAGVRLVALRASQQPSQTNLATLASEVRLLWQSETGLLERYQAQLSDLSLDKSGVNTPA